ncbi:MAG: hypothetical protein U5L95_01010 [Candidatus Saccharibacteria bacterium]|nr:hypothetical protein [Candidatus Saccharibacteria bacterium]
MANSADILEKAKGYLMSMEYENRGRPGETYERAMGISDIWLCEEIDDAFERGDLDAIRNIGAAAFTRRFQTDSSPSIIRTGAAFSLATKKAVELDSLQVKRV